jgi:hypothetical protein
MNDIPAFPTPRHTTNLDCARHEGMTLRDYFAGKCIDFMMKEYGNTKLAVENSYRLADEMLSQREKE